MSDRFNDFLEAMANDLDLNKFIKQHSEYTVAEIQSFLQRMRSQKSITEEEFSVYTDGASRGNPGEAGIGFVVNDQNGSFCHGHGDKVTY